MYKKIILLFSLAALVMAGRAAVRLPHVIGDGMIIQQNSDVHFWGWASPGKAVEVTTLARIYGLNKDDGFDSLMDTIGIQR